MSDVAKFFTQPLGEVVIGVTALVLVGGAVGSYFYSKKKDDNHSNNVSAKKDSPEYDPNDEQQPYVYGKGIKKSKKRNKNHKDKSKKRR